MVGDWKQAGAKVVSGDKISWDPDASLSGVHKLKARSKQLRHTDSEG